MLNQNPLSSFRSSLHQRSVFCRRGTAVAGGGGARRDDQLPSNRKPAPLQHHVVRVWPIQRQPNVWNAVSPSYTFQNDVFASWFHTGRGWGVKVGEYLLVAHISFQRPLILPFFFTFCFIYVLFSTLLLPPPPPPLSAFFFFFLSLPSSPPH